MKNKILLTAALLLALPSIALADNGFWDEIASNIIPLTAIVSVLVVPFVVVLAIFDCHLDIQLPQIPNACAHYREVVGERP